MTKHEKDMHEKLVLQKVALEKKVSELEGELEISNKYYLEEVGKSKAYLLIVKELIRGGSVCNQGNY